MISYVLIGRNEGWKLDLCIKSVRRAVSENPGIESEIIYVDSGSDDNSIEIAGSFNEVKIIKLTGDRNAPIARNTGASAASGDIFFFIDGDMEIEKSFLKEVIDINNNLIYEFTGGYYINRIYGSDWKYLYSYQFPPAEKLKHDYYEASTGGLFLISRKNWELAGGMKPYLYGGADPDLAFRLAKKGVLKLRKKALMGIHHTQNPGRSVQVKNIFSRRALTGRILVYRENLDSIHALKRMLRNEYSSVLLVVSFITVLFSLPAGISLLSIYLLLTIWKSIKRKNNPMWALILKDIVFISGFLLYHPGRKLNISSEKISGW